MFVVETIRFLCDGFIVVFSAGTEVVVENSFHPQMNDSSTEFKDWKKHYNTMWEMFNPLTHQRCMVELDIVPNHKLLRLFLLCFDIALCSLSASYFLSHNLPPVVFQGNDVI